MRRRTRRGGETGAAVAASLRHAQRRLSFIIVGVVVLFVAVLVPFAITSVVANIVSPQSHQVVELTPKGSAAESVTYAHLDIIGVDEWAGVASVRVTGQHACTGTCAWDDRLTFVSIPAQYAAGQGLPPAQEVLFHRERSEPVNQTIQLPIYGEPVRYPFDTYRFVMGILVLHESADGSAPPPANQNQTDSQQLFASLRMLAPRMQMSTPRAATAQELTVGGRSAPYLATVTMTFKRPVYIQVLTVLLVLLVTAAAAYAVFLRPLDDLVVNSGALVLGIWGVRAILLGSTVPGFTAVDLALSVVILFLLAALTVRALLYLRGRVTRTE